MNSIDLFDGGLPAQLQALDANALRRTRRVITTPCSPEIDIDGRRLLAFASNDYLGLANHPMLIAAAQAGVAMWGVGAGASHLVSGHTSAHEQLESRLARFTGMGAALSFSTGYMANIAVMPALLSRGDEIFADRLNHASLVDGALLARAALNRYPHGDMQALEKLLEKSSAKRKLLVTDSVFSMDGDVAPLSELLALAERYNAWLLVDDAHGFGILGKQGRGSLVEAGLDSPRLILMGTLGKAAGVAGAFVAGTQHLIDWLIQKSRAYIFTTAAPPMLAHTAMAAIDLIEQSDERRAKLITLQQRFQRALTLHHWKLLPSRTPIQPVLIGDNATTVSVAERLYAQGIWVPAIRPPTVPKNTGRLRISISASHTVEQVERLADTLNILEKSY